MLSPEIREKLETVSIQIDSDPAIGASVEMPYSAPTPGADGRAPSSPSRSSRLLDVRTENFDDICVTDRVGTFASHV